MNTKRNIYTTAGVFLVISIAVVALLIVPTFHDIQKASHQIMDDRQKVLGLQEQNLQIDSFKKKYQEYEPNLQQLDRFFFDPQNPISFIKFLEKTALELNLDATINLAPTLQKRDNELPITIFQVYAKGSFQDTVRFADQLESGPYLIKIYNLTLEKAKAVPGAEAQPPPTSITANFLIEVVSK